MIVVFEPTLRGSGHSVLNAGILITLRQVFPSTPIAFFADASHLENVRAHLPIDVASTVAFRPVSFELPLVEKYPRKQVETLVSELFRETFQAHAFVYLLTTSFYRFLVPLLVRIAAVLAPDTRVITHFMLHGTNRDELQHRSRNPLVRRWDVQSAIQRVNPSEVKFLVLDAATIPAWADISPQLEPMLLALDIAIMPGESLRSGIRSSSSTPLKFGLLGQATEAKGFFAFRNLAERVEERTPGMAEFHLVGRLSSALARSDTGPLKLHSEKAQERDRPAAQMDRHSYMAKIATLDYVCLLYTGDYYDSGASGVFYDAVNLARPIIALPTRFIEDAFARFGNIGFLCRTAADVDEVVRRILHGDYAKVYPAQVRALQTARQYWLPEAVAARFRASLEQACPELVKALRATAADMRFEPVARAAPK